MKNRNEKPRNILNFGNLCPNDYWQQFSEKKFRRS